MAEPGSTFRDVAALTVDRVGRVEETGDRLRAFRVLDEDGVEVEAVSEFPHHMLADDASPASLRSYAYELLAWFRFLSAVGIEWHVAGRAKARDFADAHSSGSIPPGYHGWRRSAPTSPTNKAGWEKSPRSRPQWPRQFKTRSHAHWPRGARPPRHAGRRPCTGRSSSCGPDR